MKVKKENGLVGVDIVMAVLALMIFSSLIFIMIFNNTVENIKLKKETMAIIYITEVFEEIGIQNYSMITKEYVKEKFEKKSEIKDIYDVKVEVENPFSGDSKKENIMKKITVTLSYQVNGEIYSVTMKRIKVKE